MPARTIPPLTHLFADMAQCDVKLIRDQSREALEYKRRDGCSWDPIVRTIGERQSRFLAFRLAGDELPQEVEKSIVSDRDWLRDY